MEANDNAKFLRTLEPWFKKLNQCPSFPELPSLFVPMMHIILLIWKNSRCFNTTPRLVILMQQICNALVRNARKFVSGEQIFQLIADEEPGEAVEKLKVTVEVCNAFKSTYADYKATADAECPSNAWRIPNEAIFARLDAFLERIHDVLEFTQTIIQFSRLIKIEIGGTKGGQLTQTLHMIYDSFESAVKILRVFLTR